MSKIYTLEYINGITTITFFGTPSLESMKELIDDIAENHPYEKRLWDFSDIHYNWAIHELQKLSEYAKLKFIQPNKLAIITTEDFAYGIARQFTAYREEEKSEAAVFHTKEEAIEWLNQ